jgi:hypothetical protein
MSQQGRQHPAGFVGHDSSGHFVHYCHCGKWAPFGYGARKGKLGTWFCGDHRQEGPVPVIVTLSEIWVNRAIEIGKDRHAYARAKKLKHRGPTEDIAEHHIMGALGEAAVAKHFRLPWKPAVGIVGGVDVGGIIEVRATRIPGLGDLRIEPPDKDDLPYVLVHMRDDNTAKLVGWLYGREGKSNEKFWNAKSGAWWVKPPYRPISELMGIIRP